ncbi:MULTISPECIES: fructosamine kinase family protein [unclassified Synechococcus]|uniref:fructosamine kinase family protein n=1 Tax=unclassified Synechococcus TaxID=2626047 RepID=UPI000682CB99|nr:MULTISPECIES: fructosamine kinase family protein [unclassified Synechococcus]WFN59095.1 fructosamine kinase family protein [Synechococcus sp. CCFWC 502]
MREPWVRWLEETLGQDVERCRPVGGGCSHSAWALELAGGSRLFAKTNQAQLLPVLEAEMEGLLALGAAAGAELVVPSPLHCALAGSKALLVIDWLDLLDGGSGSGAVGGTAAKAELVWEAAGAALARLHRRSSASTSPGFGWPRDNYIGNSLQPNRWSQDWGRFFAGQRLGPQLKLAERSGRSLKGSRRLLELTPEWLNGHGAVPCLVHGDLWGGNAARMALSSITPGSAGVALFDPAVYLGDREVDLAMAQLFGGFSPAFFSGYDGEWPRPAGHSQRRRLYDLYHLLNHANLFGGGYWGQAQGLIAELVD